MNAYIYVEVGKLLFKVFYSCHLRVFGCIGIGMGCICVEERLPAVVESAAFVGVGRIAQTCKQCVNTIAIAFYDVGQRHKRVVNVCRIGCDEARRSLCIAQKAACWFAYERVAYVDDVVGIVCRLVVFVVVDATVVADYISDCFVEVYCHVRRV